MDASPQPAQPGPLGIARRASRGSSGGREMKLLFLLLLGMASLRADTGLQLLVHTPGSLSDGPSAGATYSFPDTAVEDGSVANFRSRNTSTTQVYLVSAFLSSNSSFVISGTSLDKCIASGSAEDFNAAFVPLAMGFSSGALQIAYKAYPVSSGCPVDTLPNFDVMTLTTLQGNGLAATLSVSVTNGGSSTQLRYGDTIAFGQVAIDSVKTLTVDVKNVSNGPLRTANAAVNLAGVFAAAVLARVAVGLTRNASAWRRCFIYDLVCPHASRSHHFIDTGTRHTPISAFGNRNSGRRSAVAARVLYAAERRAL